MKTRLATVAALALASALLAACGPAKTPTAGAGPTAPGPSAPAPSAPASAPAGSPAPAVKDIPAGNCTLFVKADAIKLLGALSGNNKALDLATDGGTRIDQCSYLDIKGLQDIEGTTYAVVRYDNAATAYAKAKKLQAQMLDSANQNNWPLQSMTIPARGAGPVLAGYGTRTEDGIKFTIAVIGTNVGPYLVAALGASSESVGNAKKYALAVFQKLSSAVG